MTQTESILLQLIRAVVTGRAAVLPDAVADWPAVVALAYRQGVPGIALDGMATLPREQAPDRSTLLQLAGGVIRMEKLYARHRQVIADLARFYGGEDIRMMLLKGYGLSLCWPRPDHRPTGDIDCYNFGRHEQADRMVRDRLGTDIDNSHHKHSVFHFNGVMVENHYDFLNVHGHKSTAETERILKDLTPADPADWGNVPEGAALKTCDIPGVWLPSDRFNALYLLRHSGEHFASVDMSLRIVLDWGFFVRAAAPVDWTWLLGVLDRVGMRRYLAVLDAICVRHLGFDEGLFPPLPVDDGLVRRSLRDILHPEVEKEHHDNLVREVAFRFSRWRRNGWKHDMVFRERRWQSLLTQLWSHLLKPSL